MDLRVIKTEQSIRNAFIELRKTKPLEKITIKELSEAAMINKGTFYLHYHDIYALSETIENELIENVVSVITEENIVSASQMIIDLAASYTRHYELFKILFSGNRINGAADKMNALVKKRVYAARPHLVGNESFDIRMTATIYGCFYAYATHGGSHLPHVVDCLAQYANDCMNTEEINDNR